MRRTLTQLQVFKVQTYMNENRATICGRTIHDVQLSVQFALGFNVPKSKIIDTAKMLNMNFSKIMSSKKSTVNSELAMMHDQIKTLAKAVKEMYDDDNKKPRQEVTEILECRMTKRG